MKKHLFFPLLMICLFVLSASVFAADPWDSLFEYYGLENESQLDGLDISWDLDSTHKNVAKMPVIYGDDPQAYTPDVYTPGETERASITLQAVAYIPTYIRLELSGNSGKRTVRTFGPIQLGSENFDNDLIFDNEIGGFVDESWSSLGHGEAMEIAPGSETYIQASDYLKAEVFSNNKYKYEVQASPLVADIEQSANPGATLNLDMAYSISSSGSYSEWTDVTFEQENQAVPIAPENSALTKLSVMHRFRVPYTDSVAAGKYTGTIYFKVYSL